MDQARRQSDAAIMNKDLDIQTRLRFTSDCIPNEGINQKNLKKADVSDKLCFGRTKNLGLGVDFQPSSEGDFLTGPP